MPLLSKGRIGLGVGEVGQAMILTYDATPIVTVYRDVVDASGERDHVEVSGEGYATPLHGTNLQLGTSWIGRVAIMNQDDSIGLYQLQAEHDIAKRTLVTVPRIDED